MTSSGKKAREEHGEMIFRLMEMRPEEYFFFSKEQKAMKGHPQYFVRLSRKKFALWPFPSEEVEYDLFISALPKDNK